MSWDAIHFSLVFDAIHMCKKRHDQHHRQSQEGHSKLFKKRMEERQVLISPYALTGVNKKEQYIAVDLTKKQIEDSPSLNSDKPVSRQFENFYHGYYGYPSYWTGEYMWGFNPYIVRDSEKWAIRYLIIDTQNFWPGKKVLVSPQWIERISWEESKVFVN